MQFVDLTRKVEELGAHPDTKALGRLGEEAGGELPRLLASMIDHIGMSTRAESMASASRETATHYVWPIWKSQRSGAGIYVNEFKHGPSAAISYARSVHNHRYDFVTIPLAGGYLYQTYDVQTNAGEATAEARLTAEGQLNPPGWLVVDHREYHRLSELAPNTLTLVLKSAPCKPNSYSVDLTTGVVLEHVPVEDRVPQLLRRLESCLK